ncbi:hypothetical protein H5410_060071 [Solanum commersonii]|uniref:Uncharacterized protein n=1 Tax=Solanum commersonii TaxID=4109 RepID=A0A9J5W4F7_SOLCO|nr:hypothetical protein H5410_060071 [Solanum commersonii]
MSFSTLSLTVSLISVPFEEGNLLVTPAQETTIMNLIEGRWEEWIGEIPLKITYPALEGHEWRIITGFDPKNTGQSYLIGSGDISKSEAIALYMEEVKRDLMKNLDFDIKDDTSMASASHTDDTCLAGEGQDIDDKEEEDLETILKRYQQQMEESSTSTTDKGKNKI